MAVTIIDNWQTNSRYGWSSSAFIQVDTYEGNQVNKDNFDLFSDSFAVGDTVEFSFPIRPWGLRLSIDTPLQADSVEFEWEYVYGFWSGSPQWTHLNVINGDAFTKSGVQDILFVLPSDARGRVGRGMQVRCKIKSVTNPTEGGHCNDYPYMKELAFQVTGTSESYSTIYDAEKNGTLTIYDDVADTTITSICTLPTEVLNSVTRLQFTIDSSTTIGTGDTITVNGTDMFGNTISEVLDTTANGTYQTTASFQTLTDVQCSFSDGNLKIETLRAGGIEKAGDRYGGWFILYHVWFGDGTTTTEFKASRALVEYGNFVRFYIRENALYQHGEKHETDLATTGVHGGALVLNTSYQDHMADIYCSEGSNTKFNFYGGYWGVNQSGYDSQDIMFKQHTEMELRDVVLGGSATAERSGDSIYTLQQPILTLKRLVASGSSNIEIASLSSAGISTIEDALLNGSLRWMHVSYGTDGMQLKGVRPYKIEMQASGQRQALELLNATGFNKDNWTWRYTDNYTVYDANVISWEFDLIVLNEDGDAIEGASVVITDYLNNTVYSGTTDSAGSIPTQVLREWTRDEISGVVQDWVANTPHTVIVSKDGYFTETLIFNVDRKTRETIVLNKGSSWIMPMGETLYKNLDPSDEGNKFKYLPL